MFTLDTESGFDQVVFITVVVRPGRDRRAGRGESRRVLRLQAEPRGRAAGDPAQERRRQGDQDGVRRRGRRRRVGARRSTCRPASALRFSITDAEVEELARLRAGHREALRQRDGHRVGPRRRRRQALHPAGAPRDGEVAAVGRRAICAATGSSRTSKVLASGRAIGQKIGQGAVRLVKSAAEMDRVAGRRRAGHRHDRPRLGAGDEARRGDRHQSRRTHLPRGDHRARARHSGGRRLRRCDAGAVRRAAGDRVVRRRRHRPRLRRAARRSTSSTSRSTACRRRRPRS